MSEDGLTDKLQAFSRRQQNGQQDAVSDLNKVIPISDGIDLTYEEPKRKLVNIRGCEQHEAIINDSAKCKELGLDQYYEIMVYLKRWGNWLDERL